MKAKQILKFMLTKYVDAEQCGIISVEWGEYASEYLADLCDDVMFDCDADYFHFFTTNESKEYDLKKCLEFADAKFADYELPTEDGWYILFKIED